MSGVKKGNGMRAEILDQVFEKLRLEVENAIDVGAEVDEAYIGDKLADILNTDHYRKVEKKYGDEGALRRDVSGSMMRWLRKVQREAELAGQVEIPAEKPLPALVQGRARSTASSSSGGEVVKEKVKMENTKFFNPDAGVRRVKEISAADIITDGDQQNMVKGWELREALADFLDMRLEDIEELTEDSKYLIGCVMTISQRINSSKKNDLSSLVNGSLYRFRMGGKQLGIMSNAGMANPQNLQTNNWTMKAAFAVIAPAMEGFAESHTIPVLQVQGLSWKDEKAVRTVFLRPLNLLLCLDGIQCAYDWHSNRYSADNQERNLIDPSYAYGVTFIGIYQAMKPKLGTDQAEEVAHKSASKKIGRLVSAGYVVDANRAIKAASLVKRTTAVPREVAAKIRGAIDSGDIKALYERHIKTSEALYDVLKFRKSLTNDPDMEAKMDAKLRELDQESRNAWLDMKSQPGKLEKMLSYKY